MTTRPLPDPIPLFDERGALSREFLLHRGYCCGNGCRNCPYDHVACERRPGARVRPEPGRPRP